MSTFQVHPNMAVPPAQLSCEQCQQRKTRCSKTVPCSACLKAGISCTAVQRHRLPRGRSRYQKHNAATVQTLSDRVANLEAIIAQSQRDGSSLQSKHDNTPFLSDAETATGTSPLGTFVAPDFWAELSDAVSGLRHVIECDEDGNEDFATGSSTSITSSAPDSPNVILFGSALRSYNYTSTSAELDEWLLTVYKERVDPIFKPLHWPSALQQIRSLNRCQSDEVKALESAIHFAAACALFESERSQRGIFVEVLLQDAEAAFVRAGLLTTTSIVLLQAFVIYLAGLRAIRANAQQWTLTATAIRLANAQGIPMHFKESLDGEVQRRLWSCIGVLDLQSAFDRGSKPLIQSADLTALPLNVDDADLSSECDSVRIEVDKARFTEMSLSLVIYEAGICQRRLTEIGLSIATSTATTEIMAAKEQQSTELARFERSVQHASFLCCLSDEPIQRFTVAVANECLIAMRLLLHRPLYRRNHPPEIKGFDRDSDVDVLVAATKVLESNQMKRIQSEFAPWAWFAWVKWYALAVVLAELCKANGPEADRAWKAAQKAFDDYAETVADARCGLLWKPIVRLMRKAQAVRMSQEVARRHESLQIPTVVNIELSSVATLDDRPAVDFSHVDLVEAETYDYHQGLPFGDTGNDADYHWNLLLADIDNQIDTFGE